MFELKKIIVGLLYLLAQFIADFAYGYSFTGDFKQGIYWQSLPVTFQRFAVDDQEGSLLENIVRQATAEWENALGSSLWSLPGSYIIGASDSGNYIKWSNQFAKDTGLDDKQTLAVTVRYNNGNFFSKTVIILNGQLTSLRTNSGNILYKTILHELGHTLGLDHSNATSAIMRAYLSDANHLTQDDEDGVAALYNETVTRQLSSYRANLEEGKSQEGKSQFIGCGSINLDPSDSGPGGAFLSFVIGIMGIILLGKKDRFRFNS